MALRLCDDLGAPPLDKRSVDLVGGERFEASAGWTGAQRGAGFRKGFIVRARTLQSEMARTQGLKNLGRGGSKKAEGGGFGRAA